MVAAGSSFSAGRQLARAGEPGASALPVPAGRRIVVLSFDDGPNVRYTPTVLRLLAAHGDHATFFIIGRNAAAAPQLVADEVAAGDEVGNHTWDHRDLRRLSAVDVLHELQQAAAAIQHAGGVDPVLFRPPKGEAGAAVAAAAGALGYRTLLWSLSLEHYVDHGDVRAGVDRLLGQIRPGAVILAHDGGLPNRDRTMAALSPLLDGLAARGYQVVTAGQLLGLR